MIPDNRAPDNSPPPDTSSSWLTQWPPERRSTIANWFFHAVRAGHTDPGAIVAAIADELRRRLQWTANPDQRQWLREVVHRLAADRTAAEAYARTVLEREQLPPAAKAQRKHEQARAFMLEHMRDKPVTDRQAALLRAKGYAGPWPQDRAQASQVIDQLLLTAGGRHET
jgi:hypothetical protein